MTTNKTFTESTMRSSVDVKKIVIN